MKNPKPIFLVFTAFTFLAMVITYASNNDEKYEIVPSSGVYTYSTTLQQEMFMEYKFFGHEICQMIKPINEDFKGVLNALHLYDLMQDIWCEYSCAPRMRKNWSKENMTLGQCSITSFLIQDIFGGEVYGVPLKGGGYHCFNVVNYLMFDLTSEQFGNQHLAYTFDHPQRREIHFADKEKEERYLYLKNELLKKLAQ